MVIGELEVENSGFWAEGFEAVRERDSDPGERVRLLEPAPAVFVSNVHQNLLLEALQVSEQVDALAGDYK